MHEISIAQSLIDILNDNIKDIPVENNTRIVNINLKIGKLMAVVPESLEFCFEVLTKGTIMEGAKLNIENISIKAKCNNCGHEFIADDYLFVCVVCGKSDVEVISGQELQVDNFEIE